MIANKTNFTYKFLLIAGAVIFLYLLLVIPQIEPIWNSFWDTNDYKLQSERPVFSKGFFAPVPEKWYTPRPFTVPLVYKLAGSNPFKMVMLQKFFYCLSVFALLFSLLQYLKNKRIRIISFFSLLFFFTWWTIVGWSNNVVSESISLSFMFLWFAVILIYYKYQNTLSIILLLITTVLLSFSRDTWPYIILVFFGLNIFILRKKKFKITVPLFLFSIVLLLVQGYTVKQGQRVVMPIFNSIAGRVSHNDDYLNWFIKRGMPQSKQLVTDFRNVQVDTETGKSVIYKRYSDSTYTELFTWIKANGKTEYQKFLLSHPYYFLMQDQTGEQLKRIFAYDVRNYNHGAQGFFVNAENVFPLFNIWCTLPLVIICAYVWRRRKKIIYGFPVILFILFTANVFLSYNADTMEVVRHLFITQIVQQFIDIFMIAVLADLLYRIYKARKRMPEGFRRVAA